MDLPQQLRSQLKAQRDELLLPRHFQQEFSLHSAFYTASNKYQIECEMASVSFDYWGCAPNS